MTQTATEEAPANAEASEASQDENVITFPGSKGAKPGDQGIATQEEEPVAPAYTPKEPSQTDIKLAGEILDELENRGKLSDEAIISNLIAIVDVHPKFTTLEMFGQKGEDREKYDGASVVGEIARLLCRCSKIEAPYRSIGFWFRDQEKWTSDGVTVDAKVKRFDGFHQHINDGMLAVLEVNYHHWKTLNPRQKVFTVYHALRQLGKNGEKIAPDWSGYFEEPALFGAGVHREMVTMARSFAKDAKHHVGEPYQLSILDEVYDEKD